jgi:hypothetical protein
MRLRARRNVFTKRILEAARSRARPAVADRMLIESHHGYDLTGGAREKKLIQSGEFRLAQGG